MTDLLFDDRRQAGRLLATEVRLKEISDPIVLAVARGGVPVACEIARALGAPLDIIGIGKLCAPDNPAAVIGAIAADGSLAFDDLLAPDMAGLEGDALTRAISIARSELTDRERLYRHGGPLPDLRDRNIVLAGDGMAAGIMMRVAAQAARRQGAAHLTVAVPATSDYAIKQLGPIADDVVCLDNPEAFLGTSCFYRHFEPVGDDEARRMLDEMRRPPADSTSQSAH